MRKKDLTEVMVRAVMRGELYDSAKTRVRKGSAYLEEFEVKLAYNKDLCCRHYCLQ